MSINIRSDVGNFGGVPWGKQDPFGRISDWRGRLVGKVDVFGNLVDPFNQRIGMRDPFGNIRTMRMPR